jgi:hypothetical protein
MVPHNHDTPWTRPRPSAEEIVRRMGFPDTEQGPYVQALRQQVRKQVAQGMVNRSGGSWGPEGEKLDCEGRARELLACDWEIEHEHCHRVEAMDGIRNRLRPWIGDRFRAAACKWRIWRDRRLVNPYKR